MPKGGKRPGAGRKPKPAGEKFIRLTVKVPPAILEPLEQWRDMGFESRNDAFRSAVDLWASMRDAGFWATAAECYDLTVHPRYRINRIEGKQA